MLPLKASTAAEGMLAFPSYDPKSKIVFRIAAKSFSIDICFCVVRQVSDSDGAAPAFRLSTMRNFIWTAVSH